MTGMRPGLGGAGREVVEFVIVVVAFIGALRRGFLLDPPPL
jgi:hypothetical protein